MVLRFPNRAEHQCLPLCIFVPSILQYFLHPYYMPVSENICVKVTPRDTSRSRWGTAWRDLHTLMQTYSEDALKKKQKKRKNKQTNIKYDTRENQHLRFTSAGISNQPGSRSSVYNHTDD